MEVPWSMNRISGAASYLLSLSISNKIRFLIFIIALGMLFIGFIAGLMLFGMKNSFDSTFNNRTVSISKLQAIKDVHTLNIINTYRDILERNTNLEDAHEVVELLKKNLIIRWDEYLTVRKKKEEPSIFEIINDAILHLTSIEIQNTVVIDEDNVNDKISANIKKLEFQLGVISYLLENDMPDEAKHCIKANLFPVVDSTNIYLEQLINFHMQKAMFEKEKADRLFGLAIMIVAGLLALVLVISILLANLILGNIKTLHSSLEEKVNEKTKELTDLNLSLERKIDEEIKKSRLKDEMLHQQTKLASMGEMIANIAHQWRQPLNALTILIQSFETKSMANKLTKEFIAKQVEEGLALATSMSDTIESFRSFLKPNKNKETFTVSEALNNAGFLVDGLLSASNSSLTLSIENDIQVVGFKNSLIQVIVNVLNNAIDSLSAQEQDKRIIFVKATAKNSFATIRIIDNGGGIDKDIIGRLFEPYFTTKHQMSGTGIGLYMSKKLIEEHFGGSIEAKNIKLNFDKNKYNCAMFKITIPTSHEVKDFV